jgi:hypothetical protein
MLPLVSGCRDPRSLFRRRWKRRSPSSKRDPSHPVHARVDGLDVELRVVSSSETHPGVGSHLAAIDPWEGIALDELARILREGREAGGSAAPPEMP